MTAAKSEPNKVLLPVEFHCLTCCDVTDCQFQHGSNDSDICTKNVFEEHVDINQRELECYKLFKTLIIFQSFGPKLKETGDKTFLNLIHINLKGTQDQLISNQNEPNLRTHHFNFQV